LSELKNSGLTMTVRFFKRIKLFPGVTLNLSKRGVSISTGIKGAHVTVNKKGVRETVGLPGTGLFSTVMNPFKKRK